jgi:hypothetical protein
MSNVIKKLLSFDLCISIMKNDSKDNTIVLSTKFWAKNYYVNIYNDDKNLHFGLWDIITYVSYNESFELTRSSDNTFVVISNLNKEQTNNFFFKIINEIIYRKFPFETKAIWSWYPSKNNILSIPWIIPMSF